MKSNPPLTEAIGTKSTTEGFSITEGISRTITGDEEYVADRLVAERCDAIEVVMITIKSSTGYGHFEEFSFQGKKAANIFARQVMSASLRAYDKRDDDGE